MSDYYDYRGNEIDDEELAERTAEEVDNLYGEVKICDVTFSSSDILREMDETAWLECIEEYVDYRLWSDGDDEGGDLGDTEGLIFESPEDARTYRRQFMHEDDEN